MRQSDWDRLWKIIDRKSPDECWPYTGRLYKGKVPGLDVGGRPRGISAILMESKTGGPPRKPSWIRRRCGDSLCFNPDHLYEYSEDDALSGRFWPKVGIASPEDCWEWMGEPFGDTYGHVLFRGSTWGSHRIAYLLTNGPIPGGLWVLHKCDNKRCCNPSHLFLGTCADNEADKKSKGRQAAGDRHGSKVHPERVARGPEMHKNRITSRGDSHYARTRPELLARGSRHGCALLNESDVLEIRVRYASGGISHPELGNAYGVTESSIHQIVTGKQWAHVGGPITKTARRVLAQQEVLDIRRMCMMEGVMQKDVAKAFGVSDSAVCAIVNGKTHKDI
jgi:hypothetical protein